MQTWKSPGSRSREKSRCRRVGECGGARPARLRRWPAWSGERLPGRPRLPQCARAARVHVGRGARCPAGDRGGECGGADPSASSGSRGRWPSSAPSGPCRPALMRIRRALALRPDAAVLAVGSRDDGATVSAAVAAGARGLVRWNSSPVVILSLVNTLTAMCFEEPSNDPRARVSSPTCPSARRCSCGWGIYRPTSGATQNMAMANCETGHARSL